MIFLSNLQEWIHLNIYKTDRLGPRRIIRTFYYWELAASHSVQDPRIFHAGKVITPHPQWHFPSLQRCSARQWLHTDTQIWLVRTLRNIFKPFLFLTSAFTLYIPVEKWCRATWWKESEYSRFVLNYNTACLSNSYIILTPSLVFNSFVDIGKKTVARDKKDKVCFTFLSQLSFRLHHCLFWTLTHASVLCTPGYAMLWFYPLQPVMHTRNLCCSWELLILGLFQLWNGATCYAASSIESYIQDSSMEMNELLCWTIGNDSTGVLITWSWLTVSTVMTAVCGSNS
jgi:hypothetical protein